jgi:hypothetical protein
MVLVCTVNPDLKLEVSEYDLEHVVRHHEKEFCHYFVQLQRQSH